MVWVVLTFQHSVRWDGGQTTNAGYRANKERRAGLRQSRIQVGKNEHLVVAVVQRGVALVRLLFVVPHLRKYVKVIRLEKDAFQLLDMRFVIGLQESIKCESIK